MICILTAPQGASKDGDYCILEVCPETSTTVSTTVRIHQISIVCVPGLETKNDTPVRLHGYGPEARHVASEGMESEAGQIHVADLIGCIEAGQNPFDFLDVVCPQIAAGTRFIQTSKTTGRPALAAVVATSAPSGSPPQRLAARRRVARRRLD